MSNNQRLMEWLQGMGFSGVYFDKKNVVGYTDKPRGTFWALVYEMGTYGNFNLLQVRYNQAHGKGTKHKCSFLLA